MMKRACSVLFMCLMSSCHDTSRCKSCAIIHRDPVVDFSGLKPRAALAVGIIENIEIQGSVEKDVVGPAIVGGIVAGTPGAIVGALVGQSDKGKQRIDSCTVSVYSQEDGVRIRFRVLPGDYSAFFACTKTLKKGDTLIFYKNLRNGEFAGYVWEESTPEIILPN